MVLVIKLRCVQGNYVHFEDDTAEAASVPPPFSDGVTSPETSTTNKPDPVSGNNFPPINCMDADEDNVPPSITPVSSSSSHPNERETMDLFRFNNYGNKPVVGTSVQRRLYYRCSHKGCVRPVIMRSFLLMPMASARNHPVPVIA